jgi:sigma-B regulation protein RsbU (phosphoserine phosphatase)
MPEYRVSLSFEPDFRNVDLARAAIRGVCGDFIKPDSDGPCCLTFCLAVTEAMNNAVEHSGASLIVVEVEIDGEELLCRLITEGPRFDSSKPASLPENNDPLDVAEGGYGLTLMQKLTDRLEYDYVDGNNILTLRKRLSEEKGKD